MHPKERAATISAIRPIRTQRSASNSVPANSAIQNCALPVTAATLRDVWASQGFAPAFAK
ncbi:hypothetical protein NB311A_01819 [Nitrobacter sp. Nb-311A]|nr:hypothetical protein NB311A_01819 [Nitrobacter sp. Nb-311A]